MDQRRLRHTLHHLAALDAPASLSDGLQRNSRGRAGQSRWFSLPLDIRGRSGPWVKPFADGVATSSSSSPTSLNRGSARGARSTHN